VRKRTRENDAVSEIVGEMLLLAIVLVLLAVFSSSLSNYLPSPRDPSVTIRMSSDNSPSVTLYHQGGDIVKKSDLILTVGNQKLEGKGFTVSSCLNPPRDDIFGLGDSITVPAQPDNEITLATSRTVIFKGKVEP
jgi:archaeal type IV pilus assembly protein PilA